MKTLIELYDDRPIENVLATEVFRPARTVYLCPQREAQNKPLQAKMREYFAHKGVKTELVFIESSLYKTDKILKQLRSVVDKYEDCVLDITGGTEAALFACGELCAGLAIPVFTYSRKRNRFYNISNAEFADDLPCEIRHCVEDCFLMAGGAMRTGRVDNSVLGSYLDVIDPFFRVFLRNRAQWTRMVSYFQRTSQTERGTESPLSIEAPYTVKGERGTRIDAPDDCLFDLEKLGFLTDVKIGNGVVSYTFRDKQIRTWLRDIGSVLELYVYKACLDSGIFNDVRTSVIVDWDGDLKQPNVTNEVDVMAMQGIIPAFISCKTGEASTEALNELAVLRDRFGGKAAKAAIVTAKSCQSVTRHRASELNIDVIDLNDLKGGTIRERLKAMMRVL